MATASYSARLMGDAFRSLAQGYFAWGDGNWKVALMNADAEYPFSPDQDTMSYWTQVMNQGEADEYQISLVECSGGNYAQQTLTFPSPDHAYVTGATPGGTMNFKANPVTFSNITANFNYVVIWYDGGSGLSEPLLGYVQLTEASSILCAGQDFVLTFTDNICWSLSLDTV